MKGAMPPSEQGARARQWPGRRVIHYGVPLGADTAFLGDLYSSDGGRGSRVTLAKSPLSLSHTLPLIAMSFVAGGLVANAAFAMFVLLPGKMLGYDVVLSGNLVTALFLIGGLFGIVQIARDKPSDG